MAPQALPCEKLRERARLSRSFFAGVFYGEVSRRARADARPNTMASAA